MRAVIRAELTAIEPFDELEREHLADALHWIDSGAGLFRMQLFVEIQPSP